jgi:Zn-finger nucleic acid-binding protein
MGLGKVKWDWAIGVNCSRCGEQLTVADRYNWQGDMCEKCNVELIKRIELFKQEKKDIKEDSQ